MMAEDRHYQALYSGICTVQMLSVHYVSFFVIYRNWSVYDPSGPIKTLRVLYPFWGGLVSIILFCQIYCLPPITCHGPLGYQMCIHPSHTI